MDKPHWRTIPGFVKVGILGKSYGTSGEVRLRVEPGFEEDVASAAFLFVEIEGSKVPFAIDQIRFSKDILISFAEMDDRDKAIGLSGNEIFLPEDEVGQAVAAASDTELKFSFLTGFTIIDEHTSGEVGSIDEVREFPQQEMAILKRDGQEIMIPLHEDLIVSVDEGTRVVVMGLPDGLLEL